MFVSLIPDLQNAKARFATWTGVSTGLILVVTLIDFKVYLFIKLSIVCLSLSLLYLD